MMRVSVFRAGLAIIVALALLPFGEMPSTQLSARTSPTDTSVSKYKPGSQDKSKPKDGKLNNAANARALGSSAEKKTKPEVPTGDFANPPDSPDGTSNAIPDKKGTPRGKSKPGSKPDRFNKATAKVIASDARTTTYENPDKTKTMELFSRDANFQDASGTWREIDNTWVREPNGSLRNAAGPVTFRLADKTGAGPLVTIEGKRGATSFSFRDATPGITPEINGGIATYRNIMPGVDLQLRAFGSQLKDVLVVHDKASVRNEWLIDLHTPGLKLASGKNNTITMQNATSETVTELSPGVVVDHKPTSLPTDLTTTITPDGKGISLKVDAAYFANATYPVMIDPTWGQPGAVNDDYNDAFVVSTMPNFNFNGDRQFLDGVY